MNFILFCNFYFRHFNRLFILGCVFNLDQESPKYPPHLFDATKNVIIQPVLVANKRVINLPVGQQVIVACAGWNNVLNAANLPVSAAECVSPSSQLRLGAQSLGYKSLGCKTQAKETLKTLGKCSTGGTLIEIGWQIKSSFLKQITICHQQSTANTLYSSSVIRGASILADDESNTRPPFRQGSFFAGINVNRAYLQTSQMATFTRILGSAELARRYLDPSKSWYLSRGHLAPDGDFVDAASQDMTYYYINCAPQWQSFNNGNWKALETAVRNLASGRMTDFTIYTGTFGILTLADVHGQQKPITLSDGKIPVPKYYWKVIHDPASGKATAVIGINNPYLTVITGADVFCPDVCNQVTWIKFERTRLANGYTFCCTVQSLRKIISYSPDLGNLSLLI